MKNITKKQAAIDERNEYKAKLMDVLSTAYARNGHPVIYTALKHVSASGMSRHISCYISTPDRGIVDLTWNVAHILDYKRDASDGGLVVSGCGMDMGFHVVYSLSCALYCPDKYTHKGAYTLDHEWI